MPSNDEPLANDDTLLPVPRNEEYEALFADLDLKPGHRRFVEHYILTGNRRASALETIGRHHVRSHPEMDSQYAREQWARDTAQMLMRNPAIQNAVARVQAYYSAKMGLQIERILGGLKAEAFFDPAEIFEPGSVGTLRPIDEWPLEIRQCLKKFKTRRRTDKEGTTTVDIEVEFSDRQEAKRILGQHLGLWDKPKGGGGYTLIIQRQEPALPEPKPVKRIQGPGDLIIDLTPNGED